MDKPIKKLEDLKPDKKNARKHNPRNIGMVADAIREVGVSRSGVIDENGNILDGNGTYEALSEVGIDKVKVVKANGNEWVLVQREGLTKDQKTKLALYDNRTAELADWEPDVLKEIYHDNPEFMESIFFEDELDDLLSGDGGDAGELEGEDDVPEPPVKPKTKTGDIYQLGEHRLLCGDATKQEDVELLMDGQKSDICFTSPPYGLGESVSLSGNKSMSNLKNAYKGHKDDPSKWKKLMDDWWSCSVPYVTAWVVNIQPLAGNKRNLFKWINDRVSQLCDLITWDKGHAAPAIAQGVMSSSFEWMVIFGKDGASRSVPFSSWRGTVKNVYSNPQQKSNEFSSIHAATMPIHVPEWVFSSLCDKSKSVYDPFAGTGTTLIACEKLNRKCYMMEIDPAYCDVIVERYKTLFPDNPVVKLEMAKGG